MRANFVLSLQDLAVLAAALLAGGQIFVLFVVLRTMRHVELLDSFHLHQRMLSTDYPDTYIQPSGILMFVLGAVLLAVEPRSTANVIFTVIPMVCIACIVVLTRAINRPINRTLGTWTDVNLAGYPALRRRWDRGHVVRALCGTTALISFILLVGH